MGISPEFLVPMIRYLLATTVLSLLIIAQSSDYIVMMMLNGTGCLRTCARCDVTKHTTGKAADLNVVV